MDSTFENKFSALLLFAVSAFYELYIVFVFWFCVCVCLFFRRVFCFVLAIVFVVWSKREAVKRERETRV